MCVCVCVLVRLLKTNFSPQKQGAIHNTSYVFETSTVTLFLVLDLP